MARTFTNARGLLEHLLDRHEDGVAAPMAAPDYEGFASILDQDRFIAQIEPAVNAGAVRLGYGTGRDRVKVKFVRLCDAGALYAHLGREPARSHAERAHEEIVSGLNYPVAFSAALDEMKEAWSRNRSWCRIEPQDIDAARKALLLATRISQGHHEGADYRTFSRLATGDSKALERLEPAVLRLVSAVLEVPSVDRARDAFLHLGLDRFAPPLLVSGPVDLDGAALSPALSYIGLPAVAGIADCLSFTKPPLYLLTIENFASFNRHVLEVDAERRGLTIYSGGYPSRALQQALSGIARRLPCDIPCFHWSDIDPDGVFIFLTVARALGRPLHPHLMDADLAARYGTPITPDRMKRRGAVPCDSPIAPLAAYLASSEAHAMEQEEIDPVLPVTEIAPNAAPVFQA